MYFTGAGTFVVGVILFCIFYHCCCKTKQEEDDNEQTDGGPTDHIDISSVENGEANQQQTENKPTLTYHGGHKSSQGSSSFHHSMPGEIG